MRAWGWAGLLPVVGAVALAGTPEKGPAPVGEGEILVRGDPVNFQVFTYKPANFSSGPVFFVFHGMKRNASNYRDYVIPLAQKMRGMVAAPLFDQDAFPSLAYAQGKILREDGRPYPRKDWSFAGGAGVIRAVLEREGNPQRTAYLIGHSAGGQFAVRYTALGFAGVKRVVAANPGTYCFPRKDWDWPYGFGKLPGDLRGEENIRKFLSAPLTLYLGQADTNNTVEAGNFDASPAANLQGANRLERGRNFFEYGRKLAEEKGWEFTWKKVEVPNIGHDGRLMLKDLRMEEALGLGNKAP